jgi:hypothetical protein
MNAQNIDKNLLKTVLEEMLTERNPALKGLLEELLTNYIAAKSQTDSSLPINMKEIRKKYALTHESFIPLQSIFSDAPSAEAMTQKLRK